MSIDDIKQQLQRIIDDPGSVSVATDEVDKLIAKIISIERKHLYALQSSSVRARREEIMKVIEAAAKDKTKCD